ncbi:hypothetical protein GUJ93_ZPchr0007g5109 [Zizania palustris]|uniref:HTH myb-type domain-containing protein n=1 Tax=Zizania palustris TaxID=103762 RepID=A0A8J5T651_ZIZPA|nr:hypothetical protein GUJ93_ZPchr0007g5109 [Zizania palustris]
MHTEAARNSCSQWRPELVLNGGYHPGILINADSTFSSLPYKTTLFVRLVFKQQTFQYMPGTEQMYHQKQLQVQSHLSSSSRPGIPPEKQFLLQGGADSGLVLSTDAKPRLKWTSELHERFVQAVHQLGGPDKATPKTIMTFMGIPGLTLYHLKSHLQKYRLSKNLQAQASASRTHSMLGCATETDKPCEGNGSAASHLDLETQTNSSMHISEALQMQIEVQRQLHEQLEVERHLQLGIEAQGKYLQSTTTSTCSLTRRAGDHLVQRNGARSQGTGLTEASRCSHRSWT